MAEEVKALLDEGREQGYLAAAHILRRAIAGHGRRQLLGMGCQRQGAAGQQQPAERGQGESHPRLLAGLPASVHRLRIPRLGPMKRRRLLMDGPARC